MRGSEETKVPKGAATAASLRTIGSGLILAAAYLNSIPASAEESPQDPPPFAARAVDTPSGLPAQLHASSPPQIRLTIGRGGMATEVRLATGPEATQLTAGRAGEIARVSIASVVGGAEVIASRSADIVGRPIDIFRPAGVRSGGPTVLPSGMPVAARVSSGFGWRTHPTLGGHRAHSGVDLAAPYGSPVIATADGIVGQADWRGGYGLFVAVESGGVQTRYAHMSRLNVVAGQRVRRGDVIGYVGSTGRSTGPHLHYEVRVNGRAVDPLRAKVK